jgi:hypothetical protein
MNAIMAARIRAIVSMRKAMDAAKTYEDIVTCTPTCEHRTKERYDSLIRICQECSPDGYCKSCGCEYSKKLALRHFYCGLGKFNED